MNDIFYLAFQRIRRKRKSSLLFFLVLLLSFASAIVSVSVVGSIDNTNGEYRLNTYGEWYFAIPCGGVNDGTWLSKSDWTDSFGTAQSIGTISSSEKTIGLGTIDKTLIDIGRIRLDQGSFPSSDSEIAMEADSLSALGYDYTLGQEITLTVMIPTEERKESKDSGGLNAVTLEKTYTLCGVIREYSDLWYLQYNRNNVLLNSAVITETAAEKLLTEADGMLLEGAKISDPVYQYFISVSEENRDTAKERLNSYLEGKIFGGSGGDAVVSINTTAYPGYKSEDYDIFYMCIIALLTFISILCLEIIRLPSNTHSFSVLRSIGMSRGQLALMQICEALVLGLPAMLLGLPLGAGLTRLVLRLMLYSGSVPVQVHIPYNTLYLILGLWFAAILISRIIIFIFTLRVPLIGRLQMSRSKSRAAGLVRSGFIVLLLFVFSEGAIFTGMESAGSEYYRKYWDSYPSYAFHKTNNHVLYPYEMDIIEEIPGISYTYGLNELYLGLSFDGLNEKEVQSAVSTDTFGSLLPSGMVYLFAIDENKWDDVLDFGSDKAAFHNGDFVYVSVPDNENDYPLPEKEAELHIYGYTKLELLRLEDEADAEAHKKYLASFPVNTKIMRIPENTLNKGVISIITPYTVICSDGFLEKLLEALPAGNKWWTLSTGGKFGYDRGYAVADSNSDDLSTDIVIAEICKKSEFVLTNDRQKNLSHVQENVQSLIMLYFSGGCICLIALMILWSNISLETKNEKRSFLIKRCIGMSKRQVSLNVFVKSLIRCLSAFLISSAVYFLYAVYDRLSVYAGSGEPIDFGTAVKYVIEELKFNNFYTGFTPIRAVIIILIGFVVPLILILYAKRDLSKDGDAK